MCVSMYVELVCMWNFYECVCVSLYVELGSLACCGSPITHTPYKQEAGCVCVCMPYASAALITVALVIRPVVDVLVA